MIDRRVSNSCMAPVKDSSRVSTDSNRASMLDVNRSSADSTRFMRLFESSSAVTATPAAEFDGGTISPTGGALLLRETDRRMDLLRRFSECFLDGRNPIFVGHPLDQMLAQRVYAIALGYEDLNDHEHCGTTRCWGCWLAKQNRARMRGQVRAR